MEKSGIDYLAFSAHKMYAPFGSGALVVRKGLLHLDPAELASTIQASGEQNVVGIAALGKAMVLLQRVGLDVIEEQERALTLRALQGLTQIPGVRVYGVQGPLSPGFRRKGGVITFGLENVPHNLVAKELAEHGGIGVRNGCFCAHLLVKHLLKINPLRAKAANLAMILFPRFTSVILPGLVRVSLGLENDEHDVDHLIRTLNRIAIAPRTVGDSLIALTHNGTPFLPRTETQARMKEFAKAATNRIYSLSPGKEREFRENIRVLKPDGQLTASGIMLARALLQRMKKSLDAHAGCIAGAGHGENDLAAVRCNGFIREITKSRNDLEPNCRAMNDFPKNGKRRLCCCYFKI